jgi:hypothetical protein
VRLEQGPGVGLQGRGKQALLPTMPGPQREGWLKAPPRSAASALSSLDEKRPGVLPGLEGASLLHGSGDMASVFVFTAMPASVLHLVS